MGELHAWLNDAGQWLVFQEVMSHGPDAKYAISWTEDINKATVCASLPLTVKKEVQRDLLAMAVNVTRIVRLKV